LVLITSSIILVAHRPSIWAPMPLYMVLMALSISHLSVAVMPAVFAFQFVLFHDKSKFGIGLIIACLIMVALDVWWFIGGWYYGYKYQGAMHTKIVAFENIIGFGSVLSLSVWASIRNNKVGLYLANIILFILLSWCAFPYLGELP
jgi:hypothetical protein